MKTALPTLCAVIMMTPIGLLGGIAMLPVFVLSGVLAAVRR